MIDSAPSAPRVQSHRQALVGVLAAAVIGTIVLGAVTSRPRRLVRYGVALHEGGRVPSYSGVGDGDRMPHGRFHVHVIGDRDGAACFDRACRGDVEAILARGGHVHGLDTKVTLGVPLLHDGVAYAFADRLMVISDDSGVIRAIYRNAGLADLALAADLIDGKVRWVDRAQRAITKLSRWARGLPQSP